ncbi:hypothetical protein A4V12_09720 [Streptomyces noursei]|nr:hypothetical protein A4V12_09720 [Streptomyces noursei]
MIYTVLSTAEGGPEDASFGGLATVQEDMKPRWMPCFDSANVAGIVSRTQEHGGSVHRPRMSPAFRSRPVSALVAQRHARGCPADSDRCCLGFAGQVGSLASQMGGDGRRVAPFVQQEAGLVRQGTLLCRVVAILPGDLVTGRRAGEVRVDGGQEVEGFGVRTAESDLVRIGKHATDEARRGDARTMHETSFCQAPRREHSLRRWTVIHPPVRLIPARRTAPCRRRAGDVSSIWDLSDPRCLHLLATAPGPSHARLFISSGRPTREAARQLTQLLSGIRTNSRRWP